MGAVTARKRVIGFLSGSLLVGIAIPAAALVSTAPMEANRTVDVAAGVIQRQFAISTSDGPVEGNVLVVDLNNKRVSADLLFPGAVAARDTVSRMADARGAVAGISGDFFDVNSIEVDGSTIPGTGSPVGPAIADGVELKSAVSAANQRYGPGLAPGATVATVIGVGTDRIGRVDELTLDGTVATPYRDFPLDGLNQYALKEGGIGAFTSVWGSASRIRATCGSDTDRSAPCSAQTAEVVVDDGVVVQVSDTPGSGDISEDAVVLVGREQGAETLKQLKYGDRVDVDYHLESGAEQPPFEFAIGGAPILRVGQPLVGLDDAARAPRTSAGVSIDGRTLYLVTVDGREESSIGLTIQELADFMRGIGVADAVNLDGGGSSTFVAREPGEKRVTVQNDPSDGPERSVPNGIGIFVKDGLFSDL